MSLGLGYFTKQKRSSLLPSPAAKHLACQALRLSTKSMLHYSERFFSFLNHHIRFHARNLCSDTTLDEPFFSVGKCQYLQDRMISVGCEMTRSCQENTQCRHRGWLLGVTLFIQTTRQTADIDSELRKAGVPCLFPCSHRFLDYPVVPHLFQLWKKSFIHKCHFTAGR